MAKEIENLFFEDKLTGVVRSIPNIKKNQAVISKMQTAKVNMIDDETKKFVSKEKWTQLDGYSTDKATKANVAAMDKNPETAAIIKAQVPEVKEAAKTE